MKHPCFIYLLRRRRREGERETIELQGEGKKEKNIARMCRLRPEQMTSYVCTRDMLLEWFAVVTRRV